MIGRTVSHYRILDKLGEGGMGVVYKAEDTKLDRFIALKFLPTHLVSQDAAKRRFIREAKTASALDHPNIGAVHDIDETPDGQMFIVMPYYEGETLQERLDKGPMEVDEALGVVTQVAEGLAKAHEAGMVHRDIKPANIIVTKGGAVKIVDFGLATLAGHTRVTTPGTRVGTFSFMSPEQMRGEETDARSDIFSLGVVLYELLTGHPPFRGDHEAAVSYAIVHEDPTAPRMLRPGVPEALERVVMKCLEKDRDKRFQSVNDVAAELGKARTGGAKLVPGSGRRSWAIAGVIVIALILAAAGLYRLLPRDRARVNRKSIAVLPFTNLSANAENEYFSDGVTEDILAQLSKIGDLTVISRTSVLRYKDTKKSLREIGSELGVATILEGSVRRSDDKVRIVSQLIDARTDKQLWAETYDRNLEDIFEIQSDVAKKIATALEAEFSPVEKERIEKEPTGDLAAYDYYLKGREYNRRYRREDNEHAVELFKKALELDPNFGLAYVGIAGAYGQRVYRLGFTEAWLDSAIVLAEKARSINPNLAGAHAALGNAYFVKGWRRKALEAYHKAVEVSPNYFPAVANIGVVYSRLGEKAEALRWYKKSVALQPTSAITYNNIAGIYWDIGEYAKAEQWYNRALEIEPDYIDAEFNLSYVYLEQGKDRQAREQIERALSKGPDNVRGLNVAGDVALFLGRDAEAKVFLDKLIDLAPESIDARRANISLGYLLWKAGDTEKAIERLGHSLGLLKEALERGSDDYYVLFDIASVHAVREESAAANEWLQRAIDTGWLDVQWLLMNPLLENLHGDGQFEEMTAQLKDKVNKIRKQVEAVE